VNSPVINNSASVNINEQGNSSLLPSSEKVSNIKGDILTETSKDNHLTIKETFEVVDENSKTIDTLSTQDTVSLSDLITFDYSKKFESPGSNRYSSEFKNYIVYQIVSGKPLKNLTKKESLDEKTTRGWLDTLLENFNFDPYQRDTWFNNDELIKTIKNEGITIFNKDTVSKKRNPFSLNVEELNLSKESLTQLKLSGIDKLEHFDAFTLKELRMLLTNTFEEITSVLKQYALPRTLENLNFSKDIIDILKSNAITDLKDLLASDPESIVEMFKFDTVLNAKVSEVLSFYTSEPNRKERTQNVSRTLPSTKLPKDIKKTLLSSESKAYDFHSNKDINIKISTSTIKDVIDLIWNRNHSISKFITGDTPSISLVKNSKNSLIKRYISPLEQQYIILYSIL
jgi:nucleoid DNA-binding protein